MLFVITRPGIEVARCFGGCGSWVCDDGFVLEEEDFVDFAEWVLPL